jgi:hypothetical protein
MRSKPASGSVSTSGELRVVYTAPALGTVGSSGRLQRRQTEGHTHYAEPSAGHDIGSRGNGRPQLRTPRGRPHGLAIALGDSPHGSQQRAPSTTARCQQLSRRSLRLAISPAISTCQAPECSRAPKFTPCSRGQSGLRYKRNKIRSEITSSSYLSQI